MVITIILFSVTVLILSFISGLGVAKVLYPLVNIGEGLSSRIFAGFVQLQVIGIIVFGILRILISSSRVLLLTFMVIAAIVIIAEIIAGRGMIKAIPTVPQLKLPLYIKTIIHWVVVIALFAIQVFYIIPNGIFQTEAMRNVYVSTGVFDTGICQTGSPLLCLYGSVSRLLGIHPLIFIFNYLPFVVLLIYYLGYFAFAQIATRNNTDYAVVMLIIVELLSIWGYQSDILGPYQLLTAWFSPQCFAVHGILLFSSQIMIAGYEQHYEVITKKINDYNASKATFNEEDNNGQDEEYQEEWDMKKHKIINARNLAIAMGILAVALLAFVFVLNNKINTLHESTVNLQADLNSRSAVYEFSPVPGSVEGYLIKGTDGSLTMVGGGSTQYGDALYDFLSNYGTELSNWYLYGTDEGDTGAYAKCVYEKGVFVNNVYVLERTEIENTGE